MSDARLALMGAFELKVADKPIRLSSSVRRVVAFIALAGRPASRMHVAGRLWPESTDAHAGASLRSALWRLHRSGARDVVSAGRDLALAPAVRVDAHRVTEAVRRLLGDGSLPPPDQAAELCQSDDLLPGWYDDWVGMERERFRQLRLHGLERLCELLIAEGRLSEALEAGLAAVRAEPLRESAHRAMIGVHLAEGNVSEALRQYATCKQLMERELGMQPTPLAVRMLEDAGQR
jgi:DNA-binding SARP family transcriptional activator